MSRCRIANKKQGGLNTEDRLELARLLIKAGYTVRIVKDKVPGTKANTSAIFVEYWEDEGELKSNV